VCHLRGATRVAPNRCARSLKLKQERHTLFPIDTLPRKKQCIIQDLYGPNSWYNTPAINLNPPDYSTKDSQSLTMALNNSNTLMFKPLYANDYLEILTSLLASTKTTITTTELEIADSLLYHQRTRQCDLHPPDAKRQRLQIIHQRDYQLLAYKLSQQVVTPTHESQMLVTMDSSLKEFRAVRRADAIVDLTDSSNPTQPPPVDASVRLDAATGIISPSPVIKDETTKAAASTSTKHPAKPAALSRPYTWSHKPMSKLNTPIQDV
jgi:hypothetical protein